MVVGEQDAWDGKPGRLPHGRCDAVGGEPEGAGEVDAFAPDDEGVPAVGGASLGLESGVVDGGAGDVDDVSHGRTLARMFE
jgi:hypothetical protein